VIKTLADKRTAALFSGQFVKAVPADIGMRAKRKLDLIDSAASLDFLRVRPAIGWRRCVAIEEGNIAFASTTNGAFAFAG
jgi:plasmid maintenance system killer protein